MTDMQGPTDESPTAMPTAGRGPLAGVRVVDLTTTLMGPYCGLLLAQMGADVIKVERPGGDVARFIGDRSGVGLGAMYVNFNRGKRSVVLDLHDTADREVLFGLVARADVFNHNLRPAAAARLGLTYDELAQGNPRLVHCSMHGFDQRGPWRAQTAYDDVIQAASGIATMQGGRTDEPTYIKTPIADKTVALFATSSILAALHERNHSGVGQAVEVPMFETMAAFTAMDQMGETVYDPPRGPIGYVRLQSPHRRPYRTSDGHIAVLVYTDRQWLTFFDLIGRADLAQDARFATIGGRTEHIDELYRVVAEVLTHRSTAEWLEILGLADIPAAPVLDIGQVMDSEQATASELFETVDHPVLGRLRQPGFPVTFGRTPPAPAAPAAVLGADTDAVRLDAAPGPVARHT